MTNQNSKINKILFVTLTNIGDVILTLPALDYLRNEFPEAKITVMVGPRPKDIFKNNPAIDRFIIYDKYSKFREKVKLFNTLRREEFDLVVDLRNSLFGALLPARCRTSPFLIIPKSIKHTKERHLYKIPNSEFSRQTSRDPDISSGQIPNKFQIPNSPDKPVGIPTYRRDKFQTKSLYISPQDEEYIRKILKENRIGEEDKIIVIAAGARSHIKRWAKEKFVELIPLLINEFKAKIIVVGDKEDAVINKYITEQIKNSVIDLSARSTIAQLACLLDKARLLITNDSAVLHLGSYLNIPVVAIFGPTDEEKYGPWSDTHAIVKKEIFCRPCEKAQCRFGTLGCMNLIKVGDVLRVVQRVAAQDGDLIARNTSEHDEVDWADRTCCLNYKRILIVRTDRIGDVILSTPVIKALRDEYPNAYIAMMVSPYTKEIVEGNPYLDEVIIYDKDSKHKSWLGSFKFASYLRKKKFDLALILHPTKRVHLITFFAGIPKRVGYNRKLGFLLTDKTKHTKQFGEKHEVEYNLDLVRYLGIEPKNKDLFMPIKQETEKWTQELFASLGIEDYDKILAIHPGASCPSKIWPNERFAGVADRLSEKYGFKIILIAGPKDIKLAESLAKNMRHQAINLAGKTSVSQLASILKKCQLFISNDAGPVHIASAMGVPVISIFGRNQNGLSPRRWGPVGKKDRILHKEVGCIECLAHNCAKEFACLRAITVEDALNAVDLILNL